MSHSHRYISEAEYLLLEEMSPFRHEWIDGMMLAIGSPSVRPESC